MIRLIASDIDGTLLQEEERAIAPAVLEQITRLEAKGILFCPASGRQYSSLRRLFAPVADRVPFLCENGAVVYGPGSPGAVLGKSAMDRTLALRLCREIMSLPGCEVLISGADTSYLCTHAPDYVAHMRDFVGNNIAFVSGPEEVPEEILKVSAYCRQGAVPVKPQLALRWQEHFRVDIAGEQWVDLTVADKGTGLRQLCAALGISPEEVLAFGDNYNDIPMLDLAGQAYIMAGAAEELRSRWPNCRRVEEVLRGL